MFARSHRHFDRNILNVSGMCAVEKSAWNKGSLHCRFLHYAYSAGAPHTPVGMTERGNDLV